MDSAFFIKLVQFILSLSLLVLLHEGGHFLFSKIFGVRVNRFYIFFNPKFHLFSTYDKWFRKLMKKEPVEVDPSFKTLFQFVRDLFNNGKNKDEEEQPVKIEKDEEKEEKEEKEGKEGKEEKEKKEEDQKDDKETEYGIGWVPLGGYCDIAGMIDETSQELSSEPKPWEFRTKPVWQRLLIITGGVLVNFLLALFIYSMVLFTWGESYIETKNMTQGMQFNADAKAMGFKDGDILLGTDTKTFKEFGIDFYRNLSEAKRVDLIRDGKKMSVNLPGDLNLLDMLKKQPTFVVPFVPCVVDSVLPETPAASIDIKKGDKIVSLNGKEIKSWNDFTLAVSKLNDIVTAKGTSEDSLKYRTITLGIKHSSGDTQEVTTKLDNNMHLGVVQQSIWSIYKPTEVHYGFFESFPAGIRYGLNILRGYVNDLKYVPTAEGAKSLGGFGTIGNLFPAQWDWLQFWSMTAFLSIILAFMNILPIPALDGGHMIFLLYEGITRRKPSEKVLIVSQYIGMGILLLLMIVANLNDILRWIGVM